MGRVEGGGVWSQEKPKNKDTQAKVKSERQKIQPVFESGTETGSHSYARI